ncbi:hypothetical protein [uncultured Maritimibacter sp.]|jgi:hypothetical protein|uniref:hypothetical protein n=1 Tax=uncultured Maritimibacter sp. TaxID=991866 RepID=UPI0026169562|nr:hypothetical protein [uncultured Maritimibacter sp.]
MPTRTDIHARPLPRRPLRRDGLALVTLGLVGIGTLVASGGAAVTGSAPLIVFLVLPVMLGVAFLAVSYGSARTERRIATVDMLGVEAGVFGLLPWDQIARIERRAPDWLREEALIVRPKDGHDARRVIHIGRSARAPEDVVRDVLEVLEEAGMRASYVDARAPTERPVWAVTTAKRPARQRPPSLKALPASA